MDDDKHIYKYKSVNEIINDIYRHMNRSDKDNVIIYDVSDSSVSNRSIDRFIKALGNDKKSFVWNNKMFTNDETEEGMDIVGALYNSTLLSNMKLESKLKQIDDKVYGFYPTKNIYELINFKDDDYNKIYKEISNENFEKIFVILSGDIKKSNLLFINNTKRIYLVYENDDCIKKIIEQKPEAIDGLMQELEELL